MTHQDWTPVIWNKNIIDKNESKKVIVNNKQKNINSINNTIKKIYDETNPNADPDIKPILIDKDLAKEIQTRRLQKKMSQQQLATALSLPLSIINDYEKGTGIRNGSYITKIKKYLNF